MMKLKFESYIFNVVILVFCVTTAAFADLQWITGGVPKNTEDKSSTTVVKDAPSDQTNQGAPNQDIVISHMTVSSGNARVPGSSTITRPIARIISIWTRTTRSTITPIS